jgi:hypothetical protein
MNAGVAEVQTASTPVCANPTTAVEPTHVLRRNRLLEGIDDAAFAQIADQVDLLRFRPEQIIFEEDDRGDCLYLGRRQNLEKRAGRTAGDPCTYVAARLFRGDGGGR